MPRDNKNDNIEKKLDAIIELLQCVAAVQLYKNGVSKRNIGKHLHIATATAVKMLKGIKKES